MKILLKKIIKQYPKCYRCEKFASHHEKNYGWASDKWVCDECATSPFKNVSISKLTKLIEQLSSAIDDSKYQNSDYINDR